jgi:hypothetical protein
MGGRSPSRWRIGLAYDLVRVNILEDEQARAEFQHLAVV